MNQGQMGLSALFSAAIVGLAAVALYEPDRPVLRPPATARVAAPPAAKAAAVVRTAPTPRVSVVSTSPARPSPSPSSVSRKRAVAREPRPVPAVRPVSRVGASPRARRPFAEVAAGETLADVARRIYGPDADPGALWLSNRDQIATVDAPLAGGMRLRTPWP